MIATMTCWTVTSIYLCQKLLRICSVCKHNSILSSFMTCHRVCNKHNTTVAKCGAGTVNHSGAYEFITVLYCLSGVRVVQITCLHVLATCYDVCVKAMCSIHLYSHLFVGCSCFIYVICIHLRILVSNTFPYQMMFMFYLCYWYSFTYTGVQHLSISDDVHDV
jgi:hypothetical protein